MPDIWKLVEVERLRTVDALRALTAQDWDTPSLCAGWRAQDVLAHLVATAEIGTGGFLGGMIRNGFRFDRMVANDIDRVGSTGTDELLVRLTNSATSRRHPPGPVASMLMEIVVHGEDIAFALGRKIEHSDDGLVGAADFAKTAQPLVGCRKRIMGLELTATDHGWSTGSGPAVRGPLSALLLAMSGRKQALEALSGDGVAVLRDRP
ncbi:MAG TPA: maleylpyruvate isomerase family mycothiol-dependent enzyme [Pseudonocardiaceae bacterium]|jgi:uncharacterized protein (TIGR03083 family)